MPTGAHGACRAHAEHMQSTCRAHAEHELLSGDRIELYTVDGQRYEYIVHTVLVLDELGATLAEKRAHARWLDPTDEPVLTLITCWPAWSYTHRIVVRADLNAP